MVKLLFFCFRVTNSKLQNKNIHFELLTRSLNFYFLLTEEQNRSNRTKLKSELKDYKFLNRLQMDKMTK